MPKEVTGRSAEVFQYLGEWVEHSAVDTPELEVWDIVGGSKGWFANYIVNQKMAEVPRTSPWEWWDITRRFYQLHRLAFGQTQRLLDGAREVMERAGQSREEVITTLGNLLNLGRQFGRMGGVLDPGNAESVAVDDYLADLAYREPDMVFDVTDGKPQFNETTMKFIHDNTGKGRGCPAMTFMVEWNGQTQSLYDIFWQQATVSYIEQYQRGEPYKYIEYKAPDD